MISPSFDFVICGWVGNGAHGKRMIYQEPIIFVNSSLYLCYRLNTLETHSFILQIYMNVFTACCIYHNLKLVSAIFHYF